jgi:hypothetical protein
VAAYPWDVDSLWNSWVFALLPTILVGLIFWVVMRAIVRADRTERKVYATIEAEERERLGQPAPRDR